jgi:hypothetical protein
MGKPANAQDAKRPVIETVQKIPNWETLFGSLSYCDCSPCHSIYSPAAYFVDLLQFLKHPNSDPPKSQGLNPQQVLFQRRPDLQYIKLNCENTKTPLPYIDLVNEILESYVAIGNLGASTAHDTGEVTPEELSANPQYVNDTAYDKLRQALYPFSLPFNRPLEVARVFLTHLGTSPEQLMTTFQSKSDPSDFGKGIPSGLAIACESLGISPEEHEILTQTDLTGKAIASPPALSALYGYHDPKVNLTGELKAAHEFLRVASISYEELAQLVSTHFLNPGQAITLDVPKDADPCDLENTTITIPDKGSSFLQRAHRFIRLWKKLGWGIPDLDKAIHALGALDIDDAFLVKISHVKRLQADLNLPLNVLLSFWSDIDVEGRGSLYLGRFQNPAVLKPVDPDFTLQYVTLAQPPSLALPDSQLGVGSELERIFYDKGTKSLTLVGNLSIRERDILLSLSGDGPYQTAIHQLYIAQDDGKPVPLAALPALTIPISAPISPASYILSYVPGSKQLRFIGGMTAPERTLLLSFSANEDYRRGIDNLYQMRWSEGVDLAVANFQAGAKISTHAASVLAAARLTAVDLAALMDEVNGEVTDDVLNLANLSALFRFSALAKALKLPVSDLQSMRILSGLNPFEPGSPAATTRFAKLVAKVRASGFTVAQLNYLYRHTYDPSRGVAPPQAKVDLLLQNLRSGLGKIIADTTVVPDPTGDVLRQKLAVVLDADLVAQAMSLLDGTAVYSTPLATGLPPGLVFPDDLIPKDGSDPTAKQLRFTGSMTDKEKATLLGLSSDASYQAAVTDLWNQARSATKALISAHLAGFLDAGDAYVSGLINEDQAGRFQDVLARLMRFIRDTGSRSLVKQALGDALGLDAEVTDLLLETLLRSRTVAAASAMDDFLALASGGLSGTYFNSHNLSGTPLRRIDPVVDFDWSKAPPDPSISLANFSVRWNGKVRAEYSETYTISIWANDGVRMSVDGLSLIDQWLDQPAAERTGTIALKAGQLYEIEITHYSKSSPAFATLSWSSPSTAKAVIPAVALYPSSSIDALTLMFKAAMLVNNFKMSADELAYLSAHGADFRGVSPTNAAETADFDLNALPLDSSGFKVALFAQWMRLADLFALRDSLPPGDVGLFDIFAAPTLDAAKSQLALAMGWDAGEIGILTGSSVDPKAGITVGFGLGAADYKNEIAILRLQRCWNQVKRLGVSSKQLFHWATIEPDAAQAQDIRNTAKAKYDEDTWLSIAKPLNDVLRARQKAALIDYLLADPTIQNKGITDSSGLYEYFLIDVDMSPCMMTSRIVQATAAIQLFVQRCLMNLEDQSPDKTLRVSPSAIDAEQWNTWRKQYRLWEANRKVFLYPENWILPELRDDKTPFFKELEKELLQNDVTKDTVEQALLNYLEKLDDVARLDIRGMCWQKAIAVDQSDVLHVFGRTFNTPPIYYYRRLEASTGVWTPWEKLALDIQGDHLIPVIHHGRLYLFWAIFESKADKPQPIVESQEHKNWAAQWNSYKAYQNYLLASQKWQTIRECVKAKDSSTPKICATGETVNQKGIALIDGYWDPAAPTRVDQADKPGEEPDFAVKGLPAVNHWEIKLAWSEYKMSKWTAKQTSVDSIVVASDKQKGDPPTWELPDPGEFNFGVSPPQSATLVIRVNRSMPKQSYGIQWVHVYGLFQLDDCRGALKTESFGPDASSQNPSLRYINPAGTQVRFMAFASRSGTHELVIDTFPKGIGEGQLPQGLDVLEKMPSPYSVVYPPDDHPLGESVWLGDLYQFFYQDSRRTYVASPETIQMPKAGLADPKKVGPAYKSPALAQPDRFAVPYQDDPPIFEVADR